MKTETQYIATREIIFRMNTYHKGDVVPEATERQRQLGLVIESPVLTEMLFGEPQQVELVTEKKTPEKKIPEKKIPEKKTPEKKTPEKKTN